ncbi:MAG: hypothetical protein KME28_20440 [Pelatocladus maniniholoensis HA4357-MV3]|jgi:hypothetical protein|uniref:Uncharacterized protein n=1 Tax=Pelatocladus maniniholoensis HA4357-MV3 TaxID=1117104 RepID=A0A9E3HAT1_9NOST|nr:hypothetical protein [Pelatocladus maniniholoensis HA4357-MV3]
MLTTLITTIVLGFVALVVLDFITGLCDLFFYAKTHYELKDFNSSCDVLSENSSWYGRTCWMSVNQQLQVA